MTLNQLQPGQKATLQALPEGLVRVQAIRLGLMPGTEITCVHSLNKGPVIIKKNFQQIAVGQALANEITVKSLSGEVNCDAKNPNRWI